MSLTLFEAITQLKPGQQVIGSALGFDAVLLRWEMGKKEPDWSKEDWRICNQGEGFIRTYWHIEDLPAEGNGGICIICGGPATWKRNAMGYTYRRCESCGNVFQWTKGEPVDVVTTDTTEPNKEALCTKD